MARINSEEFRRQLLGITAARTSDRFERVAEAASRIQEIEASVGVVRAETIPVPRPGRFGWNHFANQAALDGVPGATPVGILPPGTFLISGDLRSLAIAGVSEDRSSGVKGSLHGYPFLLSLDPGSSEALAASIRSMPFEDWNRPGTCPFIDDGRDSKCVYPVEHRLSGTRGRVTHHQAGGALVELVFPLAFDAGAVAGETSIKLLASCLVSSSGSFLKSLTRQLARAGVVFSVV